MSSNARMNRKPMPIDDLLMQHVNNNGLRHLEDSDMSDASSLRTARSSTRTARTNSMGRLPRMYTADSFYEINNLPVTFDKKEDILINRAAPRMYTADSLYELAAIPNCFGKGKPSSMDKNNKRAHSTESKEYLKNVPSLERVASTTVLNEKQPGVQDKTYKNYNFKNYSTDSSNSGLAASDYAYLAQNNNPKHHFAVNSPNISGARADAWRRQTSLSPNPYRTLPQYKNYNCSGYGNAPMADLSFAGSDTNTVHLIKDMPDIFSDSVENYRMIKPTAPHNETLNKRAIGEKSLRDLHELDVSFEDKVAGSNPPPWDFSGLDTINKRLLTQESIMDLHALPPLASLSEFGKQMIRDYCVESLDDVRNLPSFSAMSLNHEESNVKTARAIISNDKLFYFPECHN